MREIITLQCGECKNRNYTTSKNKKKPGTMSKLFASHPQSVARMESSRALVARFPEREEYVLSTSEFQRVKNRLLRLSNAKASTAPSWRPAPTSC